jgi:hypothetical protein
MSISDEEFDKHGYRRYQSGSCRFNFSDYLYQKRFRGPNGETQFFVNCWIYLPDEKVGKPRGITAEATMYQEENGPWFTITMHSPERIDLMEEFFMRAYRKLEMIPDPHNQG